MIDTSNTVTRLVSKRLEVTEETTKIVYDFYWKHGIVESIRSGKHTAIRVPKLGTFMTSRRKLYQQIYKYIAYIRFLRAKESNSFKRYTKEEAIERYKNDLKLLLERRNDLAKLYNKHNDAVSETDLG